LKKYFEDFKDQTCKLKKRKKKKKRGGKGIKAKLEVCKSHVASRNGDVIEMI
jgi:hypothetical protein